MTTECSTERCGSRSLWRGSIVPLYAALLALAVSANPFASSTHDGSAAHKLDRALNDRLDAGRPEDEVRVIVQSSGDREAVKQRVKTRGGRIVANHELIRAFTTTVRVQQLEALANEPDVDRISIDAVVAADATYSLLATEGLPAAATVTRSTTLTGASVRVAVIDSGLEITADLGSNRIIGFYDLDRKSTRLNSSHTVISYAVFCLKKKNNSA